MQPLFNIRYKRRNAFHFLRIGRLHFQFCMCKQPVIDRPANKRMKLYKHSFDQHMLDQGEYYWATDMEALAEYHHDLAIIEDYDDYPSSDLPKHVFAPKD